MKISVIMPSFNQGQFIDKSILSILNQSHDDVELIIMDGGSSDKSVDVIKKYQENITYWQSKPDGGQSAAINEGMKKATGDICCWLNSDDLLAENCLTQVAKYFTEYDDCQWLVGKGKCLAQNGTEIDRSPNGLEFEDLCDWDNNGLNQPSVFWRKSLWESVGGLKENLNFCMDFELWLRFAKASKAHKLNELLAISVLHDEMKTETGKAELFVEHNLVLTMHGSFERAYNTLLRPIQSFFSLSKKFSFITNNPLYRKLRK